MSLLSRGRDILPEKRNREESRRTYAMVFFSIFLALLIVGIVYRFFAFPYKISNSTLMPLAESNTTIWISRKWFSSSLTPGAIIAYHHPINLNKNQLYFGRLVAVGGDTIELREKQIFVNNKAISSTSKISDTRNLPATLFSRDTLGPITVPNGEFFVLAIQRDFEMDSRYFGTVPAEKIVGSIDL